MTPQMPAFPGLRPFSGGASEWQIQRTASEPGLWHHRQRAGDPAPLPLARTMERTT